MTDTKTAICIVNYNLPDMTDRLVERLKDIVCCPAEFYVLDNGSDKAAPAVSTTHRVSPNRRTTGGWNEILMHAVADGGYDAYWLLCNDVWFPEHVCPLDVLLPALHTFGMVHPSYTNGSRSAWRTMFSRQVMGVREVPAVEFNAPLIRFDCLKAIWPFTAGLIYGYGVDNESGYLARRAGFKIGVCDQTVIEHEPFTTYRKGADPLSKDEYTRNASENMNSVFIEKYGPNWKEIFAKAGSPNG